MGPEGGAHALGHEIPGALGQPDAVLDVLRPLPTRPPIEATRCGAEDEKAREAHENVRANEFRVLAAPVPIRSLATSPSPSAASRPARCITAARAATAPMMRALYARGGARRPAIGAVRTGIAQTADRSRPSRIIAATLDRSPRRST